jgi:hypothetical protein
MMCARWAVLSVVVAFSGPAFADNSPARDDAPWAKGVSSERKAAAGKLLEAGNDLFVQNKHREALAKYQEAVASWDHPAIRFNMVRALIALDRPLEAYDSLEKALAYGKGPLEDHVYREALNYKQLLEGQIASVAIKCTQVGVKISLDDDAGFLSCPGSRTVRTRPGSHAIVGSQTGFLTQKLDLVALPGTEKVVEVTLLSLESATLTRSRWAAWKPWALAGGGAAVAGLGAFLEIRADHWLGEYDNGVKAQCGGPAGCTAAQLGSLADLRSRGHLETTIAVPTMVVGGMALIGGIAGVIINRPHTVMRERRPTVTPTLGPEGAGVTLFGEF